MKGAFPRKSKKIRLRAASGPEKFADFIDPCKRGNRDHDRAHWYVAEVKKGIGFGYHYTHMSVAI